MARFEQAPPGPTVRRLGAGEMASGHFEDGATPCHVGIIMADNLGPAATSKRPEQVDVRTAVRNVRGMLHHALKRGIEHLTLFPVGGVSEKRRREGTQLFGVVFETVLDDELPTLRRDGIRIRFLGDAGAVPMDLRSKIEATNRLTCGNEGFNVVLALGYSGRADIVSAVRAVVAAKRQDGRVDEVSLAAALSTCGLPDPDLIIRTGGDRRLSDFMLWQAAYSELWATPKSWIDFEPDDLDAALAAYTQRERRFGGRGRPLGARAG